MIIKMNRKSKGRKGVVEYLLNEREKEGTAFTLKGNPEITKSLIRAIERKHKYLSGGLMFAREEFVTEEQKQEIMNAFEEILFVGLTSNQYNILWVEHNDKGRLELNFVIPRIELNAGNDLDLYSHRRDLPLFDMWKNGINAKYNLADPNDPRRARTISERTKTARGSGSIVANRKTLDETLHKLVSGGQIRNRKQMLELLEYTGYKVTRKNSESISVQHDDIGKKALRLKGGIYSENFTSTRSIKGISKERERQVREYDNKVTRGNIIPSRRTYQKYLQTRIERHKKRYSKSEQTYKTESQTIERRDRNNLVSTVSVQIKEVEINDRIRNAIKTSDSKRKERINRVRERENQLFEEIKDSNVKLSSSHRSAEQKLSDIYAKSRKDVEENIDRNAKRINAKIVSSDKENRINTNRVYNLYGRVNEQLSRLKKSVEGVINEIKKLKLFNSAKNNMSSTHGPIKSLSPRR